MAGIQDILSQILGRDPEAEAPTGYNLTPEDAQSLKDENTDRATNPLGWIPQGIDLNKAPIGNMGMLAGLSRIFLGNLGRNRLMGAGANIISSGNKTQDDVNRAINPTPGSNNSPGAPVSPAAAPTHDNGGASSSYWNNQQSANTPPNATPEPGADPSSSTHSGVALTNFTGGGWTNADDDTRLLSLNAGAHNDSVHLNPRFRSIIAAAVRGMPPAMQDRVRHLEEGGTPLFDSEFRNAGDQKGAIENQYYAHGGRGPVPADWYERGDHSGYDGRSQFVAGIGRSAHQRGDAVDLNWDNLPTDVQEYYRNYAAQKNSGIEFISGRHGNDPGHIQLSSWLDDPNLANQPHTNNSDWLAAQGGQQATVQKASLTGAPQTPGQPPQAAGQPAQPGPGTLPWPDVASRENNDAYRRGNKDVDLGLNQDDANSLGYPGNIKAPGAQRKLLDLETNRDNQAFHDKYNAWPNEAQLWGMHNFGVNGYPAMLADPKAKAYDTLRPFYGDKTDQVMANNMWTSYPWSSKNRRDITNGELIDSLTKMNAWDHSSVAGQNPGPPTAYGAPVGDGATVQKASMGVQPSINDAQAKVQPPQGGQQPGAGPTQGQAPAQVQQAQYAPSGAGTGVQSTPTGAPSQVKDFGGGQSVLTKPYLPYSQKDIDGMIKIIDNPMTPQPMREYLQERLRYNSNPQEFKGPGGSTAYATPAGKTAGMGGDIHYGTGPLGETASMFTPKAGLGTSPTMGGLPFPPMGNTQNLGTNQASPGNPQQSQGAPGGQPPPSATGEKSGENATPDPDAFFPGTNLRNRDIDAIKKALGTGSQVQGMANAATASATAQGKAAQEYNDRMIKIRDEYIDQGKDAEVEEGRLNAIDSFNSKAADYASKGQLGAHLNELQRDLGGIFGNLSDYPVIGHFFTEHSAEATGSIDAQKGLIEELYKQSIINASKGLGGVAGTDFAKGIDPNASPAVYHYRMSVEHNDVQRRKALAELANQSATGQFNPSDFWDRSQEINRKFKTPPNPSGANFGQPNPGTVGGPSGKQPTAPPQGDREIGKKDLGNGFWYNPKTGEIWEKSK
jgi:hypothetical protein